MYSVLEIRQTGESEFLWRINNPIGAAIELTRTTPGATLRDQQKKAQAWCDKENKYAGWVSVSKKEKKGWYSEKMTIRLGEYKRAREKI